MVRLAGWRELDIDEAAELVVRIDAERSGRALLDGMAELAQADRDVIELVDIAGPAREEAAVGTVAAVVAGFIVVQTVPFGNAPVASAAAAEVLNRAADKIGASDPVVAPGQYLYVESHRWDMAISEADGRTVSYLGEHVTQTWVPHDRTQEWLQRSYATGKREWLQGSEADLLAMGIDPDDRRLEELRARCGDFYPEGGMRPCEWEGSWQNPTPEFVAALPSDPHELYDELLDVAEEDGDGPGLCGRRLAAGADHRPGDGSVHRRTHNHHASLR